MTLICSQCGKPHDGMPYCFMFGAPATRTGKLIAAQHERKSMCRTARRYFVRCEITIPLSKMKGRPLAFICWVSISRTDYARLLTYREHEADAPGFGDWVSGTLANRVYGVADSFGTSVRFEVLNGDPTPYVKWVSPRSSLARRIKSGASARFWHDVVSYVAGS